MASLLARRFTRGRRSPTRRRRRRRCTWGRPPPPPSSPLSLLPRPRQAAVQGWQGFSRSLTSDQRPRNQRPATPEGFRQGHDASVTPRLLLGRAAAALAHPAGPARLGRARAGSATRLTTVLCHHCVHARRVTGDPGLTRVLPVTGDPGSSPDDPGSSPDRSESLLSHVRTPYKRPQHVQVCSDLCPAEFATFWRPAPSLPHDPGNPSTQAGRRSPTRCRRCRRRCRRRHHHHCRRRAGQAVPDPPPQPQPSLLLTRVGQAVPDPRLPSPMNGARHMEPDQTPPPPPPLPLIRMGQAATAAITDTRW